MLDISHIHPMIVHFPIVLYTLSTGLAVYGAVRGLDLGERSRFSSILLTVLVGGTLFAGLAALFGDMSADAAVDAGFPEDPIEDHEGVASSMIGVFALLTLWQVIAFWKRIPIRGGRAWGFALISVIGFVGLLTAAYMGGELVYGLGVNVAR